MSPSNTFDRVQAIFDEAVEKHDPAVWEEFVSTASKGENSLKVQVLDLLKAHMQMTDFMSRPAAAIADTQTTELSSLVGSCIGPYKLRELLGEGGMGSVYVAEQVKPVRRKVALKVIKPGMDSRQVIARFEAERQALAAMDHPNIAKIFDAGTSEAGRPYFVMELVRGIAITEYCDRKKLTNRERLELFIHVCQAVQHAHQKGIIHRDIKPSNVMVTVHDDIAVPKVIDFGIAKVSGPQWTENTVYTSFTNMMGTPLYMSPEQSELNASDVDTRSDVYSLGVLLYELITGTTPFDKQMLSEAGFDEMRRIIREVDPPNPSQRISTLNAEARTTVSERRGIYKRKSSHSVDSELDWIVMKTLEKNRARRYQSPSSLATDIGRYLRDEPIEARPPSFLYFIRKYTHRHRSAIGIAVLSATLLITVMIFLGVYFVQESRGRFSREASVSEALSAARLWINEQKLDEAEKRVAQAQAVLNSGTVDSGLVDATSQLVQEIEERRAGQNRLARFLQLSSDASDLMTLGGKAIGGDGKDAEKLVREAMSLFQILENDDWYLNLDRYYLTAAEKEQLKESAYVALVNLADNTIRWEKDSTKRPRLAEESIQLLNKVDMFHQPTRAYHFVKSAALRMLGKAEEASLQRKLFEEAVATSAWDHFLPGHSEGWAGRLDVAVREYELALDLQPNHFNSMVFMANRLITMNPPNYERAIGLLSGCIALRPDHVVALRWRYLCKNKLNDIEGAERDLLRCVKFAPKKQLYQGLLYLLYGSSGQEEKRVEIMNQMGGIPGVLEVLTNELGNSPAIARNQIAWDLVRHPESDPTLLAHAIELATEATELSPTDDALWNTLGVAQYRAGQWLAASESLTKALQLSVQSKFDAINHFYLAMTYWKMDERDKAREHFESGQKGFQEHQGSLTSDIKRGLEESEQEAKAVLGIPAIQEN